jgi:hypothetical protein
LIKPFVSVDPTLSDYWRGIILFGRNVATYKFALGQALLELKPSDGQLIKLHELAVPFSSHLRRHLELSDTQGTSKRSQFLDACRQSNEGELDDDGLIQQTVKSGFTNVIDAFHVVGPKAITQKFFIDERKTNDGIRITDAFSKLLDSRQAANLPTEVDARWRLVETAWDLKVSPSILAVHHDVATESLFVVDEKKRRKSISGSRGALSGYQKGHCFYCFESFSLDEQEPPEVDHFFPHRLAEYEPTWNINGVWNLVLACRQCNRGTGGKFDLIPKVPLLDRLHTRNEYLINSHHPLRETLIGQTGKSLSARESFLNDRYRGAISYLLHQWEPTEVHKSLF